MRPCIKRFVFLVLLSLFPLAVCAQSGTPQKQAPEITSPEKQLPLNMDRDPVVSPDAADNEPVSPEHPGNSSRGQTLERGAGGRYTLTRNVDEVVLNVS